MTGRESWRGRIARGGASPLRAVGPRVRWLGRPHVAGAGRISIGADFVLCSRPVQSHLVALPGARIDIGDAVYIGHGAALSAQCRIAIGRDTRIGPFVVIMDGDFHRAGSRDEPGDVAPIEIGDDVRIEDRVTILRGARIGAGARIRSGSMVSGTVPPAATVGGVPARAGAPAGAAPASGVPELVAEVLGLAATPREGDGPRTIPQWDSLGTLRLLLAIEEAYRISVPEDELQRTTSVGALEQMVARRLQSPAPGGAGLV